MDLLFAAFDILKHLCVGITLSIEKYSHNEQEDDNASNDDTCNAAAAKTFFFFDLHVEEELSCDSKCSIKLGTTLTKEVKLDLLIWMRFVLSESPSSLIDCAFFVLTLAAERVKICINCAVCGLYSGGQSSVDFVHLRQLVPDVQVELLTCLVANIGESEHFGAIGQLRGVWKGHKLIVGRYPIAISETVLALSERFSGESFSVQCLVETANGVKGVAQLCTHEA